MSDAQVDQEKPQKKKRFLPLLIGIIAMVLGAGGGFYAVQAGWIFGAESTSDVAEVPAPSALPDVSYVPIEPMVISLRDNGRAKHLRFSAQLEVYAPYAEDVAQFMPRIQDVLNTYLRAVQTSDLEDSMALYRIRGHVLHRVHLVVGEGRVRDVLITEFVMT